MAARAAGTIYAIRLANKRYDIAAKALVNQDRLDGFRIVGDSRGKSELRMTTDNEPLLHLKVRLANQIHFENLKLSYANMQTGQTEAAFIKHEAFDANPASFYNSSFNNVFLTNHYWFYSTTDCAWWGNNCSNFYSYDHAGGFIKVMAA